MCLGGGGEGGGGVNLGIMGYTSQSRVGGEISREIIAAVLTSFHPKLGSASSTPAFERTHPVTFRPH